jgi:hypothetical protein
VSLNDVLIKALSHSNWLRAFIILIRSCNELQDRAFFNTLNVVYGDNDLKKSTNTGGKTIPIGTIDGGMKFIGGNPGDPKNWVKQ